MNDGAKMSEISAR